MKTDSLINAIAQDGSTRAGSVGARTAGALAIGGAAAFMLFLLTLGWRPDLASALETWRFPAKLMVTFAAFIAAMFATAHAARPTSGLRGVLIGLALPVVLLVLVLGYELVTAPPAQWTVLAIGTNARLCLASITMLSVAPLAALLVSLRAAAPRSPAGLGAVAGLLAGALAATLYALHCFDDSPLFVALWYTPAIAAVAVIGAAAGSRLLRW